MLFNNKYNPITGVIGFVECDICEASAEYARWLNTNYQVAVENQTTGGLQYCLEKLDPLTSIPRKSFLIATKSGWTAYFDNGINGSDARTPIAYLTQKLKIRGVIATSMPPSVGRRTDKRHNSGGAVSFELFASVPRHFLNYERTVGVFLEKDRWQFQATGAVQDFERTSVYDNANTKLRFTEEMLIEYCKSLGIDVNDEKFYSGRSIFYSINDSIPSNIRQASLAEVRQLRWALD